MNGKHHERLVNHLDEAKKLGAIVELGGIGNEKNNYIAPTLISNVPKQASLLQEEIFGPILPVVTFKTVDEVLNMINSKEKPLALYIFSKNKSFTNQIINNTSCSSTSIIDNLICE